MSGIEFSAKSTVQGRLTAQALVEFAQPLPAKAEVRIYTHEARDQRDNTSHTLTATWTGTSE